MVIVFPNQKIVTVHKAVVDEKNIYMRINKQALIEACKALKGTELKAFLYLSSNQNNYEMALSTEDMATQMDGSVRSYQTAVQGLIQKGYLVQDHKNRYDFYEFPNEVETTAANTQNSADQTENNSMVNSTKSSFCHEENNVEIKHNIKKKIINNKNKDLFDEDSGEWKKITQRIKVDFFQHSIKELSEAAGTEVKPNVINRIISYNTQAFDRHMDKGQGYRYNTLIKLVKKDYAKMESAIRGEEIEHQQAIQKQRAEPRINYDKMQRADPKEPNYFEDISELLDEF